MLDPKQQIELINNSKSYVEIFSDISLWKTESKRLLVAIHPDRCSLPGATEASVKLINYMKEIESGITHLDDAGKVTYFPNYLTIEGDVELLKISLKNYEMLVKISNEAFRKYLPEKMELTGNVLKITLKDRAVPLVSCSDLPQEHLNWILSRMLEFCSWLDSVDYSHNGINPESIYVVPATHGVIFISFYHLNEMNKKISSVSGRFSSFYPEKTFREKTSNTSIDIECAKRTIIYSGGDKSGLGISLKGKLNFDWLNFVLRFSSGCTFDVYKEYRKMIDKNFEKKFYVLNI